MTTTITVAITGEQPIHCAACERRIVAVPRPRHAGVVAVTARAGCTTVPAGGAS